jgi:hypothetical protein
MGLFDRSFTTAGHFWRVALQARHDPAAASLYAGAERLYVLPAGGHGTTLGRWGGVIGKGRHGDESNHGDSAPSLAELHRISPGCTGWACEVDLPLGRKVHRLCALLAARANFNVLIS